MSRFCGYREYQWSDQFETNFSELRGFNGSIEHPRVTRSALDKELEFFKFGQKRAWPCAPGRRPKLLCNG